MSETARVSTQPSPATNLIWIDLEMTGLDPDKDVIIEIATIITNGDLQIVAEGIESEEIAQAFEWSAASSVLQHGRRHDRRTGGRFRNHGRYQSGVRLGDPHPGRKDPRRQRRRIRRPGAGRHPPFAAGPADPAAGTIAEISSHIYTVLRRMLRRLRPVVLDEFGLVAALGELVDGWNERHPDAFCRLETRGRLDEIGGDALNIHLYRIVQECLTNVSKQRQDGVWRLTAPSFREVVVELERKALAEGDYVQLSIRDNGSGLAPGTRRGLGLLGMRERVDALKGTMEVTGSTGAGTNVNVCVPLHGAAAEPGRAA